jgi:uncharacterized lipoprotein YbaY
MRTPSTRLAIGLSAAALSLLAACAAQAPAPATPATTPATAATEPAAAGDGSDAKQTIIGSRLPSKTTEKLVRQIGSQSAQDAHRNRPPDPGPRSN